jgi:hypothetical protein
VVSVKWLVELAIAGAKPLLGLPLLQAPLEAPLNEAAAIS